jgi:TolB-like protein/tetratricopeptide (TPR) repeat protein
MSDARSDPAEDSQRPRDPLPDEVMTQLGRILTSAEFAQSERLQKFMKFIVEETLAGRSGGLKEYTLALEVFGRDETFDPQTSSIVRVEASRLRGKLEKYNAIDGRNDPVQITLPPGSYVPKFQTAGQGIATDGDQLDALPRSQVRRFGPKQIFTLVAILVLITGATVFVLFDSLYPRFGGSPALEASDPGQISSVAVLPLRNLSGDADQDYFSDGITDALIASLAKRDLVRVISMTSVMGYKNVNRPVADIARELNVSHVIEGSVLRVGDKVRITAQLVEAETDRHIWAESYARDISDVLAIQDDVVRRIVASISGQVGKSPQDVRAVDPVAYEAQLRGRFFLNKMTEDGFRKGIEYFKQAIEKAPNYAEAHSGLATCFCLLGGHGFELIRPSEGMPAAKTAVMKALSLDDTLAEPHAFLGIIRLKYEWDWAGAEDSFKRAIELNPSYARARVFYSFFLEAMGRQEEAIEQAEQAKALDPLSLAVNTNLGWQYLQAGRLEQARQIFEGTAELDPDFWGVHWGLGHYRRQRGEYDEAIAAFQKAIDAGGGHSMPLSALGYAYAISGQPMEARKMLDRLVALAEESYVSPFNMATIHLGLGELDEAFAWLEKAFAERSRSMAWLNVAKEYDGIRADPRFTSLVRRVGLPE